MIERTPADEFLGPGDRVGEFRVDRIVAQGVRGTLYAGAHALLRTPVAIKVFSSQLTRDENAVACFTDQLYAVNALAHPAAARVLSVGMLNNGRHYTVMELVDGPSLREVLEREAPLHPGLVVPVFEQLCHLLGTIHAAGLAHGRLTSRRVLVLRCPPRPLIRVVGFGTVWLEQEDGQKPTARDDIRAAGALLHELVTGQREMGLPLQDDLLDQVVRSAVAGEIEDRFTTAGALFDALRAAVEPLPWSFDLPPPRSSFAPTDTIQTLVARPGLGHELQPETVDEELTASELADKPTTQRDVRDIPPPIQPEHTQESTVPSFEVPDILDPDMTLGELSDGELADDGPKVRTTASEPPGIDDLFTEDLTLPGTSPQLVDPHREVTREVEEPRTAVVNPEQVARLLELQQQSEPAPIEEEPTREASFAMLPPEALRTQPALGRLKLARKRAGELRNRSPDPLDLPPAPVAADEGDPYLSIELVSDEDD